MARNHVTDMAIDETEFGILTEVSDGSVAGEHPSLLTREILVGPTTQSEFNTIKAGLIPFACWRVNDLRFAFGSSFVQSEIKDDIHSLKDLVTKHSLGGVKPPLSVFGHADPVGQDVPNKMLSGRRAQAIYGLLTRKTELWEELYSQPTGPDEWGDPAIQIMLSTVQSDLQEPEEGQGGAGESEGATISIDQVKAFQVLHGLKEDGIVGPNTRRELFRVYMDELCVDFVVGPSEFLGKGEDSKGKGDYQGCSEFNPLLIFSQDEQEKFQQAQDKSERNSENAPNRRVMIFLFRPGTEVRLEKWPCPRVSEGINDCEKRFWSDGEDRRTRREQEIPREYGDTKDTFACRFYDRLSNKSPCEAVLKQAKICWVFMKLLDDTADEVLSQTEYTLRSLTSGFSITDKTDDQGILRHLDLPDEDFEIEALGKTETVETYYVAEFERNEGDPWCLRLRGVKKDENS